MIFPRVDSFLHTALTKVAAPLAGLLYVGGAAVVSWGAATGWQEIDGPARVVAAAVAGHFGAATAIGLQCALGVGVIGALRWRSALPGLIERGLFGWGIGFLVTNLAWLGLAVSRSLTGPAVLAVSMLTLLACVLLWRRARVVTPRTRPAQRPPDADAAVEIALAIFLGVVALIWLWPLVIQTALPNADWDSALYHLPLADRYLDGRILSADPLYSSYSFPGSVSLLYAALMAVGLESAIIPLNFYVALLTILATYCLGTELAGRRAGLFGAAVLATTHIVWQLGVDPRIDGFLCLFLVLACTALLRWLRTGRDVPHLFLVATSLNAAMGTKYTGLFFAGVLTLVVLGFTASRARRGRPAPSLATLGACALLLTVPNVFWYASNGVTHGDPVFPMLRGDYYHGAGPEPGTRDTTSRLPMKTVLERHLAELPSDSPILETAAAFEERYQRPITSHLFDPIDLLRRPEEYAVKPNHFASPLLLLFLGLPIVLIRRDAAAKRAGFTLYAVALALYVSLGSQTNLLRYALPVLPLFAAGAGAVLAAPKTPPWSRVWAGLWGIAVAALLGYHYLYEQAKLIPLQVDTYLESGGDRVSWLQRVGYNLTPAMPRVVARIHRELESGRMRPGDTILMVGEGKGRLLGTGYLPDSSWFLQRWLVELVNADLDYDAIERSLYAQGITHILYNKGYYRWVVDHTETPRPTLAFAMTHLERFLHGRTRTVFEMPGMVLFELRGARRR